MVPGADLFQLITIKKNEFCLKEIKKGKFFVADETLTTSAFHQFLF